AKSESLRLGAEGFRQEAFQRSNTVTMRSDMNCFRVLTVKSLICLALIAALGTAFEQAPTWDPHTQKPLEKYDNPPAYIYRLETSPRMVSPHGVFISYQANVDAKGNNIVGDAANECTISVDPTNGSRM